ALRELYADDPETLALLEAMFGEDGQDLSMPETAAGAPADYTGICQAEISAPRTLLLTCLDEATGTYSQATHRIAGDLQATLETLATDLAGEQYEVGLVDKSLCFWSETVEIEPTMLLSPCPDWDYRYSEIAAAEANAFDSGRIAHHAPEQMVLGQPYFLEVAIQPIQRDTSEAEVDEALRSAMGTGLAPGSSEGAMSLSFDTVRASQVMTASAVGTGFDLVATTPAEQPVVPGAPTVWQWQVTPRQAGTPNLTFTVSQMVEVNGRNLAQAVKTIPLSIKVTRLEDLLADSGPAPSDLPATHRSPAPESDTAAASLSTTLAPASDASPQVPPSGTSLVANAATGLLPDTEIAGCTWVNGPDPDRQAMVLSNLDYSPPVSRLAATHRDGDRITAALNAVGFSVLQCEDLGQRQTVRALSLLGRMSKARKDAGAYPVTFFYYSGHGVNIDGTNFILPTDIPGASPDDIRDNGVSFEQIFNRVSSTVAPTSFVVFDACRTVMDDQSRGLMRAYSPVGWASGVFQAFATEPGKTAADDGVYSEELSTLISTLDDPANVVFKRVQDAVAARTGQKQRPVYTDGTTGGDFYFRPAND
ncbi:MAG: caspase family protein, partial [Hyphomonas sp.]|nr:caspase family protein [Hyphomonas sp.]